MTDSTTRFSKVPVVSVKTLSVTVIGGPDRGLVRETEQELLTVGTAAGNDLRLTDDTVSRFHLELVRGALGIELRDLKSSNGTWFGPARIERGIVPTGAELELGRSRLRIAEGKEGTVELHAEAELDDIKGESGAMRRLMSQVTTAARAAVPVLVIGESGTGKELVARALHEHGERASGPFVTFDCSATVPSLIASELFGHEKGAFTGADHRHLGAFERAHGGTLFLDEIGELPAALQPQLLGALERKRIRRVGGQVEIPVDVRVVSATNRDLRSEVNAGTFRLDLYYRIAVVLLKVPALRDRIDDLPVLIAHFLRECGHSGSVETFLSANELETLSAYRWPGNVRELRNWVEATLAMGESPELREHDPPKTDAAEVAGGLYGMSYKDARRTVLDAFEARFLKQLLELTAGNVAAAARRAQMDRTYLIKLLQRHGLARGS
ncbi:MAG TPA: sigma 54-interacting transcriptional regulator [Polyangiaceae bacterium]|nr:sigma 54-interacting transcriptional regulator [Polyangiaceae bacterium]